MAISNTVTSVLLRNFQRLLIDAHIKGEHVFAVLHYIRFIRNIILQAFIMATNQQQEYTEQLQLLRERYPNERKHKLLHLLQKHDGSVDQVRFS